MDGTRLRDLVSLGMGRAARKVGDDTLVLRPRDTGDPLSSRNRVIRLQAWFDRLGADDSGAAGFGQPMWRGTFDSSYTQPGDYLVSGSRIFFIADQQPALPVLCVLTNRMLTLNRELPPLAGDYGGVYAPGAQAAILSGWPGSVLQQGGRASAGDPRDARYAAWSVLLPRMQAVPQIADIALDDLQQSYVVGAAEQSQLGWRLVLHQVSA